MMQQQILRPLGIVIALIILFSGTGLITDAVNGWALLTNDAGIVQGDRIDRVVMAYKGVGAADEFEDADDAWYQTGLEKGAGVTAVVVASPYALLAGKYFLLEKTSTGNGCQIDAAGAAALSGVPAYTQGGEKVTIKSTGTDKATVTGCEWAPASGLWSLGGFGPLIDIIAQAAGLGIPLGALIALAMLGGAFVSRMGLSPLMGVVIIIIAFTMAGSLLDTLTPFVTDAFQSFDGNRFVIYGSGLGLLARIIGNFYGIVIFGGLLVIGWLVIGQYRDAAREGMGGFLGGDGNGSDTYRL